MSKTEDLLDKQITQLWDQQENVADVCFRHISDLHYSVDMEGALYAHHELQSAINVLLKLVIKEAMLREADQEDDETDTVIHCKDCKHHGELYGNSYCMKDGCYGWYDEDFCSRAERKEE